MFDDIKKELSSLKLLTVLLTIGIGIYLLRFILEFLRNFSDIILILIFGWLLSFILEPLVDVFTKYVKLPRPISTIIVFVLAGVLIFLTVLLFVPDVTAQFKSLEKIVPVFLDSSPAIVQSSVEGFIDSVTDFTEFIPSITQFVINLITILILSFYLILEKESLNKKLFTITPKKYHDNIKFFQGIVNQTFASFVRIQLIWGIIGGVITWIVLTAFNVSFAASTSVLAGILTAVPMIGPIIGVIPPLLVALIEDPDRAVVIFLIIFLIQQFIFNVFGPKMIGKAFEINPIIVMLALLIGIKIAGFTGAVFAVPFVSILMILGKEFYSYYFKEKEN